MIIIGLRIKSDSLMERRGGEGRERRAGKSSLQVINELPATPLGKQRLPFNKDPPRLTKTHLRGAFPAEGGPKEQPPILQRACQNIQKAKDRKSTLKRKSTTGH